VDVFVAQRLCYDKEGVGNSMSQLAKVRTVVPTISNVWATVAKTKRREAAASLREKKLISAFIIRRHILEVL
jgi:hypothetical protein